MKSVLLGVLFSLLSLSVSTGQANECGTCPNGTEEVAVLVRSIDMNYLGIFRMAAFQAEVRDYSNAMFKLKRSIPFENEMAGSVEKLREIILERGKKCQRIKYLSISAHGAPGVVTLEKDSPETSAYLTSKTVKLLKGADCGFAPNAHVQIRACEVGLGCTGQKFMTDLAATLLTKGGSVRAATTYEVTFAGVVPLTTVLPKYLYVKPKMSEIRWNFHKKSCDKF